MHILFIGYGKTSSRVAKQLFQQNHQITTVSRSPKVDDFAQHLTQDIYQLDLSDASAHVMGTQFQLQPNDVVYVTAAPVARWNRVMSNIFPSVSSLLSITNVAGQF